MATHIEQQHFDHLDRPKSPGFSMDAVSSTPPFPYVDAYQSFDYLQFPHSPFNVANVPLPGAGSPRISFDSLNIAGGLPDYAYSSGASFTTGSPARPFTPPDSICPPALTHLSNGELSSDSMPSSNAAPTRKVRSNSVNSVSSPGSVHGNLPGTRGQHRFNPIGARPARAERRRRASKDDYASDDDEEDFTPTLSASANSDQRREEIRRQRIESEQRRRDELRDGYRRLKDVLPVSNQKSSKVSLLDRATTHIKYLEMTQQQLQTRLNQAEMETQRLRSLNEALMLSTAERHGAVLAAAQQQTAF
ncbi:uncharacterized protein FOMMEDRAFT_19129 [Fomitiporia mediterranea MF3/22]|uniref:uncharacterized protein n=1 Tax=Fomitiporia mediterranea (strain MF3/22) TaxID=694068 RepID=UPI00044077FD|nr:uncharacterized protein FOMMEDRAFT_19129 [Fomitiporia mediterranea MF3/22]EJD03767.1 hypothetical protein FOMMEDRAFT_19129 [Fomitiporia mediterranea MF3/22]